MIKDGDESEENLTVFLQQMEPTELETEEEAAIEKERNSLET